MSTPETAVEPISERCARGPVELAPEAIADEEGRPGLSLIAANRREPRRLAQNPRTHPATDRDGSALSVI
jgi:hypothetical protein